MNFNQKTKNLAQSLFEHFLFIKAKEGITVDSIQSYALDYVPFNSKRQEYDYDSFETITLDSLELSIIENVLACFKNKQVCFFPTIYLKDGSIEACSGFEN